MADRIYTTEEIKRIVEPIAREYGVGRLSLFGSYARGAATEKSDVDFRLIENGKITGYFELAGLQQKLEENLGVRVDVLTTGALNNDFLSRISKEEVILFEQP
jgi:predicted nucleotidyltransferase